MAQMYPETDETPEAAEGTASHEVAASLISAAAVAAGFNDLPVGMPASNGVIITEEMFEAAELYAEDVGVVMRKLANFVPNVEARIEAKQIHDLSFGTVDCWIYDQKTGHLYIWDYKFGYEIVEAFENWQAINYAAGIIEELELNGIADQFTQVHIRIAQPRAFHRDGPIREWVVNASDLRGYINVLFNKAHEALGSNPVTRSGSHCRHCSARHACPDALKAGLRLYEVAGQPLPVELPSEALGVQLSIVKRAIKQLEYIESGLDEQMKGMIRSGASVPGWKVEQGFGRERWSKPIAEVIALGDLMNIDVRKTPEAVTPKQARKLGIDDAVIMAYSETPRTGLKLVPDNGSKAKQVFNHDNK
jgi:hypothetical protein